MSASRGRGLSRSAMDSPNAHVLRKPAEAGLIQRLSSLSTETTSPSTETAAPSTETAAPSTKTAAPSTEKAADKVDVTSKICEVCNEVAKLDPESLEHLDPFYNKIKEICQYKVDLGKCVEIVYLYATKSKWNAHAFAMFFASIGDITAEETKLRTFLLRKLQAVFNEKNKKYAELDSFLMDVTLLCEIYYHIRLDGKTLRTLSLPVMTYLGMLVDGASLKEMEVFVEQFSKLYHHLRENREEPLDYIIDKMRKQIICETSNNVVVRAMLLSQFELALIDFRPTTENSKNLYKSLLKPVMVVCKKID